MPKLIKLLVNKPDMPGSKVRALTLYQVFRKVSKMLLFCYVADVYQGRVQILASRKDRLERYIRTSKVHICKSVDCNALDYTLLVYLYAV